MGNRRKFVKQIGAAVVGTQLIPALPSSSHTTNKNWLSIKNSYLNTSHPILNMNTGSAGIMPSPVLNALQAYQKELHGYAPYAVKDQNQKLQAQVMAKLAALTATSENNLAIVRNTTEAINLVLHGVTWRSGDEILYSDVDYPYVVNTIYQLAQKYGVVPIKVPLDLAVMSDQEIVDSYASHMSKASRLAVFTYITHREGRRLPAQKLCQLANAQGVEALVDGAHTVGQLAVDLDALGCDYFASSLHKWLSAPLGVGLLYVHPDKADALAPDISYPMGKQRGMTKFLYLGTTAFEKIKGLDAALDFQMAVGEERKYERLLTLARYLHERLDAMEEIEFIVPMVSSSILSYRMLGIKSNPLSRAYLERGIHVKLSGYPKLPSHLRVSVNLHTMESDLDRFVNVTKEIAQQIRK